jgi:uncharacterized protein YdeI (YjbR/CyaY-like superfamily)
MENAVCFKDRGEWRMWLEENHDEKIYVWLALYKKESGKKRLTLEEAVEEAMCFGWIDGKLKRFDDEKFILRFSMRKANSVWSKINKERAERLIKSGKMTTAGLAKIEEAKKTGLWDSAYTSKTKESIPLDLEQALMKDNKAWNNFQNFANSYRNMYIAWVSNAKTAETRVKRIKKIVVQSLQNKKLISI